MEGYSCKKNFEGEATCKNPVPYKLVFYWDDVTCPDCLKDKEKWHKKYLLYYKQEQRANRNIEPVKASAVDVNKLKNFWKDR